MGGGKVVGGLMFIRLLYTLWPPRLLFFLVYVCVGPPYHLQEHLETSNDEMDDAMQ